MKRTKRLFALLLAGVMFTSVTGCGKDVASRKAETKQEKQKVEESAEEENTKQASSDAETSDTILWFNGTYAVLTKLNSCDYTQFGGMDANDVDKEVMQDKLNEWWGVTDRTSAEEMITWLIEEGGHRVQFGEDMRFLEETGIKDVPEEERAQFIYDNFEMEQEEAEMYAKLYSCYAEKGDDAILGWDYCRAMNLLGYYYIAGYYSKEEALDKSLEIGKELQTKFDSWDSMMDSYLVGYEYWAEESSDQRRETYEEIKKAEDSPYNLDWNLALEKTW